MLAAKVESPLYWAVIECDPIVSPVPALNVAEALTSAARNRDRWQPSKNSTLPVGLPPKFVETVAVNSTLSPGLAGLSFESTATLVKAVP